MGAFLLSTIYRQGQVHLTFQLPKDSPIVDIITVVARDENSNPYTWCNNNTVYQVHNTRGLYIYTDYTWALFSYPTRLISGWTISVYENATPEEWIESF
jgi:hypothetical protein